MDKFLETVEFIKGKINNIHKIAIILGSGLGSLSDDVEEKIVIEYLLNKIDEVKKIDFKLIPNNQSYFKENIIYSFYTEGTLENGRL